MRETLERIYEPDECVSFRKTNEKFGGLSNMAPGYRVRVGGILFLTVEALYQACRFPHIPELQEFIIAQRSPMTLKMRIKRYVSDSRPDWDNVRVRIMKWCLRVKLSQNLRTFGNLLLETGDLKIVEDSRKDPYWGALRTRSGHLVGANVLGRLLMELREELRTGGAEKMTIPIPPDIPNLLLLGKPITPLNVFPNKEIGDGQSSILWHPDPEVHFKLEPSRVTRDWIDRLTKAMITLADLDTRFEAKIDLTCKVGTNRETVRQIQEMLTELSISSQTKVRGSFSIVPKDRQDENKPNIKIAD